MKRRGRLPQGAGPAEAGESEPLAAFRWPSLGELVNPREPWLVPVLVLIASRVAFAFLLPFAAEDAYITFRYARSLVTGHGLVYNPNEHVFGFSSPLWALWIAAGFKLGADPVQWARGASLVLDLATLVTVGAMLRHAVSRAAAWCFTFFWAAWPYLAAVCMSGMENTATVGLAALATAWCATRSRLAGPGLAALALVRPEGLVSACIVAMLASWRDRAIGAALVLAGIAALTFYYGSPVPQSVLAKSQIYGITGPWAAHYWWDWIVPVGLATFGTVTDTRHLSMIALVLAPAAVLGAGTLWQRWRTPLVAFIASSLVVWLGYSVLGVAFFWWYLVVPLAGWAALAATGFPRLAHGRALYLSVALLIVGLWAFVPRVYVARAQTEYFGFAEVANYLFDHARSGEKVLAEPIGMIGYQAPLVVVDEVGLVSPQVARRRRQGAGWYTDVVAEERPDWLVTRRRVLSGGSSLGGKWAPFRDLGERDSLLAMYEVAARVDTVSGDNELVVLRRRR